MVKSLKKNGMMLDYAGEKSTEFSVTQIFCPSSEMLADMPSRAAIAINIIWKKVVSDAKQSPQTPTKLYQITLAENTMIIKVGHMVSTQSI